MHKLKNTKNNFDASYLESLRLLRLKTILENIPSLVYSNEPFKVEINIDEYSVIGGHRRGELHLYHDGNLRKEIFFTLNRDSVTIDDVYTRKGKYKGFGTLAFNILLQLLKKHYNESITISGEIGDVSEPKEQQKRRLLYWKSFGFTINVLELGKGGKIYAKLKDLQCKKYGKIYDKYSRYIDIKEFKTIAPENGKNLNYERIESKVIHILKTLMDNLKLDSIQLSKILEYNYLNLMKIEDKSLKQDNLEVIAEKLHEEFNVNLDWIKHNNYHPFYYKNSKRNSNDLKIVMNEYHPKINKVYLILGKSEGLNNEYKPHVMIILQCSKYKFIINNESVCMSSMVGAGGRTSILSLYYFINWLINSNLYVELSGLKVADYNSFNDLKLGKRYPLPILKNAKVSNWFNGLLDINRENNNIEYYKKEYGDWIVEIQDLIKTG